MFSLRIFVAFGALVLSACASSGATVTQKHTLPDGWSIGQRTITHARGYYVVRLKQESGRWRSSEPRYQSYISKSDLRDGETTFVYSDRQELQLLTVTPEKEPFSCLAGLLAPEKGDVCYSDFADVSYFHPTSFVLAPVTLLMGSWSYNVELDDQQIAQALAESGFFEKDRVARPGMKGLLRKEQGRGRRALELENLRNPNRGQVICVSHLDTLMRGTIREQNQRTTTLAVSDAWYTVGFSRMPEVLVLKVDNQDLRKCP